MKQRFIDVCRKLASHSDHYQHKISSIIIKRNRIISLGYNSMKTNPNSPHEYKSTHAEWDAIRQLDQEALEDSTIFVFRERRDGTFGNSKPCPACWRTIVGSGIRKVVYTHEDGLQTIELY